MKNNCYPNCIKAMFNGAIAEQKRKSLISNNGITPIIDITKDEVLIVDVDGFQQKDVDNNLILAGEAASNYTKSVLSRYIPESILNSITDVDFYTVENRDISGKKAKVFKPSIPSVIEDYIQDEINSQTRFNRETRFNKSNTLGALKRNSHKSAFDLQLEDSEKHIKRDKSHRYYYQYGGEDRIYQINNSVTEIVHGSSKNRVNQNNVSIIYGNEIDDIVRSIFDSSKSVGPWLSDNPTMKTDNIEIDDSFIENVKKSIENTFGENCKVYSRDEQLRLVGLTGQNVKTSIAGTMDLIVRDAKGKYHIVDIKTTRTNISGQKLDAYQEQLTYYAKLCELNGVPISSINILPIKLNYNDPTYTLINDNYTPNIEKLTKDNIVVLPIMKKLSYSSGIYVESFSPNYTIETELPHDNSEDLNEAFHTYTQYLSNLLNLIKKDYRHYKKTHNLSDDGYLQKVKNYENRIKDIEFDIKRANKDNWLELLNFTIKSLNDLLDKDITNETFTESFVDERIDMLYKLTFFSDLDDGDFREQLGAISQLKNKLMSKRIDFVLETATKEIPILVKLKKSDNEEDKQKLEDILSMIENEIRYGGKSGLLSSTFLGGRHGNGTIGQMMAILKEKYLIQERKIDSENIEKLRKKVEEYGSNDFDFLYAKTSEGTKNGYLISLYTPEAFQEITKAKYAIRNSINSGNKVTKPLKKYLNENFDFSMLYDNKFISTMEFIFGKDDENVKKLKSRAAKSLDISDLQESEIMESIEKVYDYYAKNNDSNILQIMMDIADNTDSKELSEYIPLIPKKNDKFLNKDFSKLSPIQREIYDLVKTIQVNVNQTYNRPDELLVSFLKETYMKIENGVIDFESNQILKNIYNKAKKFLTSTSYIKYDNDKVMRKDGSIRITEAIKAITDALSVMPLHSIIEVMKSNEIFIPDMDSFPAYLLQINDHKFKGVNHEKFTFDIIDEKAADFKTVRGIQKKYKKYLIDMVTYRMLYNFMDTGNPVEDLIFVAEQAADYRARQQVFNFAKQLENIIEETKSREDKTKIDKDIKYTQKFTETYIKRNFIGNTRNLSKEVLPNIGILPYKTNIERLAEDLYNKVIDNINSNQTNEFKIDIENENGEIIQYTYYTDGNGNFSRYYREDGQEKSESVEEEDYKKVLKQFCEDAIKEFYLLPSISSLADAYVGLQATKALSLNVKSGIRNRSEGFFKNLVVASSGLYGFEMEDLAEAERLLRGINIYRKDFVTRKPLRKIVRSKHENFLQTYLLFINAIDLFQSHSSESRASDNSRLISRAWGNVREFLTNWATDDPEAKNQGHVITAMMIASKKYGFTVKDKNGEEHSFIENGEFVLYKPGTLELRDEFDTELNRKLWVEFRILEDHQDNFELIDRMQNSLQGIHGNYNPGDAPYHKSSTLLSFLMLFKNYLPEHYFQEYGKQEIDLTTGEMNIRGRKRELMHHVPSFLGYSAISASFGIDSILNVVYNVASGVTLRTALSTITPSIIEAIVNTSMTTVPLGVFLSLAVKSKLQKQRKDISTALGIVDMTAKDFAKETLNFITETAIRVPETLIYMGSKIAGKPFMVNWSKKYVEYITKNGMKNMTIKQRKRISEDCQQLANYINIRTIIHGLLMGTDYLISLIIEALSGDDDKKKEATDAFVSLAKRQGYFASNTANMLTNDLLKFSGLNGVYNDISVFSAVESLKRTENAFESFSTSDEYDWSKLWKYGVFSLVPIPNSILNTSLNIYENSNSIGEVALEILGTNLGDERIYHQIGEESSSWNTRSTQDNYWEKMCKKEKDRIKDDLKDAIEDRIDSKYGNKNNKYYQEKDFRQNLYKKTTTKEQMSGYLRKPRNKSYLEYYEQMVSDDFIENKAKAIIPLSKYEKTNKKEK